MSDDGTTSPNHNSYCRRYVNQIVDIFKSHQENLEREHQSTIDQIEFWRSNLTAQIDEHAKQQIFRLEKAYQQHQVVFDTKLEENRDLASIYGNGRQSALFDELKNACLKLEFQIASLTFTEKQPAKFPEVIVIGEALEKSDARRRRRLARQNTTTAGNTDRPNTNLSPSFTNADSNEPNDQVRSTIQVQGKNDQTTQVTDNNDSDKCPLCFMIFSPTMTINKRRRHINGHMDNEQDDVSTPTSVRY